MKKALSIGYLPILDHLILGISEKKEGGHFNHLSLESRIFDRWDEIINALEQDEINGAFLLFPSALDLFIKRDDIQLVLLGHREGQVLVSQPEIKDIADLKGKNVLVPWKYSTHYMLLHRALKDAGLSLGDINVVTEYKDLRSIKDSFKNKEIDAFLTAEPLGTAAVKESQGNILSLSRSIQAHHIDCVLVIKKDFIENYAQTVEELVYSLVRAGAFVNAYPRQAAEIGADFLDWPKDLLLESLTHDRGHILYWDLLPRLEDFQELLDIGAHELSLWDDSVQLEDFVYPVFAQSAYRGWVIDLRHDVKDKGLQRTIPGSVADALNQLVGVEEDDVRGISLIKSGKQYPVKGDREVWNDKADIFALKDVTFESIGEYKGMAIFGGSTQKSIDRVLLRLNKTDQEKYMCALGLGVAAEQIKSASSYTELILGDDILYMEVLDNVIFAFSPKTFRFLPRLLDHFSCG